MGEKILIKADTRDHLMEIGDKKYRLKKATYAKNGHRNEMVMEEINEADYQERLKAMAHKLVSQTNIDAETILVDILGNMTMDQFRRIELKAEKGNKAKLEHGCLDIRIGGELIPIC